MKITMNECNYRWSRSLTNRATSFMVAIVTLNCLLVVEPVAAGNTVSRLLVGDDRHTLVREDGQPFFWLADTGWYLFQKLTLEEADQYLTTRRDQGFTVIYAMALPGNVRRNTNREQELPFVSISPTELAPNEAYFKHLDRVIDRAEQLGLYMVIWPATKGHLRIGKRPSDRNSPETVVLTPTNARKYGQFIGNRYKDRRGLIWGLGGDFMPENELETEIEEALAEGIKSSGANQLMTYHPGGRAKSSSLKFHERPWLDFNMCQNGHNLDAAVWDVIEADRKRNPTKPVVEGESLYEGIQRPLWNAKPDTPISTTYEVRRPIYAGLFAGGFGCTYGANSVFQFYMPDGRSKFRPLHSWQEGLEFAGALQMKHVRDLMQSRPMQNRIPDQSLLASDAYDRGDRITATRAEDGSYAMVYTAGGKGFAINLERLSGETIRAHWFDPRTGEVAFVAEFARSNERAFTPPSGGDESDWVLVLDDASRNFPVPGTPMNDATKTSRSR